MVLAACSGGDAGNPTVQPSLVSRQIQASIDPSVPIQATQSVQSIVSSLGDSVPGSPLNVPGLDGTESFLIGIDKQERPILLGFFTSQQAVLTVDSTAQALVRIAAGLVIPQTGMTNDTIAAAIKSSANYTTLTAAITTALAAQQVPTESSAVLAATFQVANDVISSITISATQKSTVRQNAFATTDSASALPYYFWPDINVWLTDDPGTPNITFNNMTLLAWEVTTDYAKIIKIIADPALSGNAVGQIGDLLNGKNTPITAANDAKFNVTVGQSEATIIQNFTNVMTEDLFGVISFISLGAPLTPSEIQTCAIEIADTLLKNNEFAALVANPNAAALSAYVSAMVGPSVFKVVTSCKFATDISGLTNQVFTRLIGELWKVVNLAGTAQQILRIQYQFLNAPTTPITVQLCKSGGYVSPCPGKYVITPTNPSTTVGDTVVLNISATDDNGKPLDIPLDLMISTSNPAVVPVNSITVEKGVAIGKATITLTGTAVGQATVTLTSPVSGKLAEVIIVVEAAPLSKSFSGTLHAAGISTAVDSEGKTVSCSFQTDLPIKMDLTQKGNAFSGTVTWDFIVTKIFDGGICGVYAQDTFNGSVEGTIDSNNNVTFSKVTREGHVVNYTYDDGTPVSYDYSSAEYSFSGALQNGTLSAVCTSKNGAPTCAPSTTFTFTLQ